VIPNLQIDLLATFVVPHQSERYKNAELAAEQNLLSFHRTIRQKEGKMFASDKDPFDLVTCYLGAVIDDIRFPDKTIQIQHDTSSRRVFEFQVERLSLSGTHSVSFWF